MHLLKKKHYKTFFSKIMKYTCLTPYPWFTATTQCITYDESIAEVYNSGASFLNDKPVKLCTPGSGSHVFTDNKCLVPSIRLGDLNRVLYEYAEYIGVVIIRNQTITEINTDSNTIITINNNNTESSYEYKDSLIFATGRIKDIPSNDYATKRIKEIMGFYDIENRNEVYNLRSPEMTFEKVNEILLVKDNESKLKKMDEYYDCYGFVAIFKVFKSDNTPALELLPLTSDLTENKYASILKFRIAQHRIRFFMEPNNEVYIGIQISKTEYDTYLEESNLSLDNRYLIKLGIKYIKAIYKINGMSDVNVRIIDRPNSYAVFNSSPHIVKNPFCFKENSKKVKTMYGFIGDAALSANFATAGGINVGTFVAYALLAESIKNLPEEKNFSNINERMKNFMMVLLYPWSWEIYHDNIKRIDMASQLSIDALYKKMRGHLINSYIDKKLIEELGEDEFNKLCFSTLKNSDITSLLDSE